MVGMIGAAAAALSNHSDSQATPVSTTTPSSSAPATTTPVTTPPSSSTSGTYKDGTYTASVTYFTPDGQEPLDVKVTLSGNTITDTSVDANTISGEGQRYFDRFSSYYKSQVVGQKISDVSLNRVAGASLTTDAFNQALQQIMQNATS